MHRSLLFVEARPFTEDIQRLGAEDALAALEMELLATPEQGNLLRGTGGFRKARLRLPGRGKSGGARVIYYHAAEYAVVFFIFVYPKNEQADLSPSQARHLKQLSHELRQKLPHSPYAQRRRV